LSADAAIHATGLAFAVVGTGWLIVEADRLAGFQNAAVWIYGAGLITMFAISATYNIWPVGSAKLMLRRFDHSAIYLFIAATYTPFIVQTAQSALLVAIWSCAFVGVILKLGFPGRFERISIALCLALALQLPFLKVSESMGNHDSEIVGAGSVD